MKCGWSAFGVLAVLFSAPVHSSAEAPDPSPLKPTSHSFDAAGVRIHYTAMGRGEPVILVHGFGTRANLEWWRTAQVLAKDYLVLSIDCRGHGKSDKPHDPAAYGEQMSLDVVRLMDHLEIEKAHVAGYSMGGFITGKLLLLHPERVRSAVVGGAGWVDVHGKWGKVLDDAADSLDAGKGVTPMIRSLQPTGSRFARFDEATSGPLPGALRGVANRVAMMTNDPKALAHVARGMKQLSIPKDKLGGIDVPVLLIVGGNDPLKEGVDVVKEHNPGVRTLVLEDHDHSTTPISKRFVEAVKAFFDEHRLRRE